MKNKIIDSPLVVTGAKRSNNYYNDVHPKIVISNGHNKFHLSRAAVEAYKRGQLSAYLCGGYPTKSVRSFLATTKLTGVSIDRLLSRQEPLDESLVNAGWFSECVNQAGQFIRRNFKNDALSEFIFDISHSLYSFGASKFISESTADIYHYRSGYGQHSVTKAKKLGMITLCDHSIVHPAFMGHLVDNNGCMSSIPESKFALSSFWRHIDQDLQQADHILVNSDFVKNTFIQQGYPENKLHVQYLGIDNEFLEFIETTKINRCVSPSKIRFLYAGEISKRKGIEVLQSAVELLPKNGWEFFIAGAVSPNVERQIGQLRRHPNVKFLGPLSRKSLAYEMCMSSVFVFPSLAEGSARVVFEAMAAGMYVITTPNSGSIVNNGINGAIVAPGDVQALAHEMLLVILDNEEPARKGAKNAILIRNSFSQDSYGDGLQKLYRKIYLDS